MDSILLPISKSSTGVGFDCKFLQDLVSMIQRELHDLQFQLSNSVA